MLPWFEGSIARSLACERIKSAFERNTRRSMKMNRKIYLGSRTVGGVGQVQDRKQEKSRVIRDYS